MTLVKFNPSHVLVTSLSLFYLCNAVNCLPLQALSSGWRNLSIDLWCPVWKVDILKVFSPKSLPLIPWYSASYRGLDLQHQCRSAWRLPVASSNAGLTLRSGATICVRVSIEMLLYFYFHISLLLLLLFAVFFEFELCHPLWPFFFVAQTSLHHMICSYAFHADFHLLKIMRLSARSPASVPSTAMGRLQIHPNGFRVLLHVQYLGLPHWLWDPLPAGELQL